MKRKKIFYVPGAISLLGLPLLFLLFTPKEKARPCYIRFVLPYDYKSDDKAIIRFSKDYLYNSVEKKKIILVNLGEEYSPEESYLFSAKLNFISREIERLQFTHDTASVLKIKLGAANTYGHFIWVLNQALIYNLKRYALADDAFYLFANPVPDPPGLHPVSPLYL